MNKKPSHLDRGSAAPQRGIQVGVTKSLLPSLNKFRSAASRAPDDSPPVLWFWQMTEKDWDRQGHSYDVQKKQHRRLLTQYQQRDKQREKERDKLRDRSARVRPADDNIRRRKQYAAEVKRKRARDFEAARRADRPRRERQALLCQLFDAAVAIETIEHAQNIGELLDATARRLKPGATLFVHSLLHQSSSYLMGDSWMGRNFFTGCSILSLNSYCHLLPDSLVLRGVAPVNGIGYSKTLKAWLDLMEEKRAPFVAKYGSTFYEGFRMFYISCAEAFAANHGAEYMCGYYTFIKR